MASTSESTAAPIAPPPGLGTDGPRPPSLPAPVADVPLSTTKAFLLSIIVPRVHRVYVANSDDEDEDANDVTEVHVDVHDEGGKGGKGVSLIPVPPPSTAESSVANDADIAGSDSNSGSVSAKGSTGNVASDVDAEAPASNGTAGDAQSDIVGFVKGDDEEEIVEHVVTAEEMATVVKISPPSDAAEKTEQESKGGTGAAEKIKIFFGVMNKDNDERNNVYFSKEEAVAAIKDEVPDETPNTEIKVMELLRLTCKALLSEGHLFNAPIFTDIKSSSEIDGDEWVELSVMVKSVSIGVALERLERIGVGSSVGTVSIFKAELCRTAYDYHKNTATSETERENNNGGGVDSSGDGKLSADANSERGDKLKSKIEAAKAEWKNAASRLRVEQVKEQIAEQATFSFDFLSLLAIASILAGIGLITDSTVVIVASMLVSPIMGPVMGITFGSRVSDWSLAKSSAVVESLALLLAVGIGGAIGLTSSWTESAQDWPTSEMLGRGDTTGLLTGIAIAIPSGMGVALSILGNNTASLVGVAISASLLPPAVNAGICWAHAILIRAGSVAANEEDFGSIGGISFALTVINIVCIWLSGMLMFAIKEVAPTKAKSAFWSRDIKIARAVNKAGSPAKEVNLEVIRAGLNSALDREQKAAVAKSAKDGPGAGGASTAAARWRRKREVRKAAGPRSHVTFNLSVNPVPIEDISQMDERHVKAIGLEELVEPFPVPRSVPASSLATGSVVGESPAPAPRLIDDVRYVGLEDMAALLGFDDEDEEEVTPNRTGWSWFK